MWDGGSPWRLFGPANAAELCDFSSSVITSQIAGSLLLLYGRVCFVEVFLHPEDCSGDLLEWGARLAEYNARPPQH